MSPYRQTKVILTLYVVEVTCDFTKFRIRGDKRVKAQAIRSLLKVQTEYILEITQYKHVPWKSK